MEINSHILKLSGSGELDGPLEHAKTYAVGIEIEVEDGGLKNHQDGTHDKVWKGKLIRAKVSMPTGEVRTKDKSSQSVKLRRAIFGTKENFAPELDDDAYYERVMGGIRHYLHEIIELVYKKDY